MPFWDLPERKTEYIYDAFTAIRPDTAFRPDGVTAIAPLAATFTEPALLFPVRKFLSFDVVIVIQTAMGTYASGVNDWTFDIKVGDAAGANLVTVTSWKPATGAVQKMRLSLSSANIAALKADAGSITITATKLGTPSNLDYSAFLARLEN